MTTQINEVLADIQCNLNAPKGQRNNFGNYDYRSAEDILGSVKPFIKQHGCILLLSDEMVLMMDRFYVKATATLKLGEESISVDAYARETETKKGMDEAQVTGSASSYARKHALNGLFCIDDVKDPDTQDNREHKPTPRNAPTSPQQPTESTQNQKQGDTITRDMKVGFGKKYKDTLWKDVPDTFLEWVRNNTRDDHVRLFVNQEIEFRTAQNSAEDPDAGNPGMKPGEFHNALITVQNKFKEQPEGIPIFSEYLMKKFSTTNLNELAEKEVVFSTRILNDMRDFFKEKFPDWDKS